LHTIFNYFSRHYLKKQYDMKIKTLIYITLLILFVPLASFASFPLKVNPTPLGQNAAVFAPNSVSRAYEAQKTALRQFTSPCAGAHNSEGQQSLVANIGKWVAILGCGLIIKGIVNGATSTDSKKAAVIALTGVGVGVIGLLTAVAATVYTRSGYGKYSFIAQSANEIGIAHNF
jgi:hypothetical protein